ncbi:MAG: hypothetical protein O7G86_08780 [Gammaproteobacteria bacterium]|nr:hypothetical protein [Gammaproteobacteria bacterium]
MRVVPYEPGKRVLALALAVVLGLTIVAAGYLFGLAQSDLDLRYVAALREIDRANETRINKLNGELIDARLSNEVSHQASQELRQTIKTLHDEVAGFKEEVTFYKSLMAPSSVERGLHIQEFEVTQGELPREFSYYLLLTQVEARRSWIQGDVRLNVSGRIRYEEDGEQKDDELVLSLTEIAETDAYPLKFRFRYFQDLSGMMTLPSGFTPQSVVITALRRGGSAMKREQTFDWVVLTD